jgi:TPR repeat protein
VRQDDFEAAKWLARAAEQGHPAAQNALGYMYYQGMGVRRDYRQAADSFRRAAEQNCALAQFNLGVLYQAGLGVPLDYGEAYKWFTLAIEGGYAESRRVLEALTQIMTKPQLRDGKASVSDWV